MCAKQGGNMYHFYDGILITMSDSSSRLTITHYKIQMTQRNLTPYFVLKMLKIKTANVNNGIHTDTYIWFCQNKMISLKNII